MKEVAIVFSIKDGAIGTPIFGIPVYKDGKRVGQLIAETVDEVTPGLPQIIWADDERTI